MKKYILLSLNILIMSLLANAQMSYRAAYHTTVDQFAEGNKDIITNASTIIDGIQIDAKMKSLVKEGELDGAHLIKLTHVLRSNDLKTGDTIILIFRNVASGTESRYNVNVSSGLPHIFSINPKDQSIYGEWFLKEYSDTIDLKKLPWPNKKIYEFYISKYGFTTVYFKDQAAAEAPFDVYALFNLEFKTRQEWYNYLKKYDNIKVPEGY